MRIEQLPKELISALALIFIFIAFIPIFKELGIDYTFMEILIFGVPFILIIVAILFGILKKIEDR